MKPIKLILTAGATVISLLLVETQAAPISPEEALNRAAGFQLTQSGATKKAPSKDVEYEVAYTFTQNGRNCFYVINHSGGGFTIVSADDRLCPVLGFSENGSFDYDKMPPNMKWWLEGYEKEIDAYLKHDPTPQFVTTDKRAAFVEREAISPMLTSLWNQTEPYNLMCPIDYTGKTSVTGCVATAMAQVMRYHQWPKNPKGSSGGFDFDGTTLDWANMLDSYEGVPYTTEEAEAVALLMRECGASVNMQYSSYESGAYNQDVQVAMREYFDYNPSMSFAWRDYHNMAEWNDMVYKELKEKRPVYYSGRSSRGGHAFVCDGYLSSNFFHFNWGWGGYQDGYFLLNALNPATGGAGSYEGGYNIDQSILLDFRPSKGETKLQMTMVCSGAFIYRDGKFTVTDDPDGYDMFYNPLFYVINGSVGIKATNFDDPSDVHYFNSGGRVNLDFGYGFSQIDCKISGLKNGKYKLTPAFYTEYGEWNDIGVRMSLQHYVTLTVNGASYEYENEGVPQPELIAGYPHSTPKIYGDAAQAFTVVVNNISESDFSGQLYLAAYDADNPFGNIVSMEKYVTIAANSSMNVEFVSDRTIAPARYEGYLTDYLDNTHLEEVEILVENFGFQQRNEDVIIKASNIAPNFLNSLDERVPLSFVVSNLSDTDTSAKFVIKLFKEGFNETTNEIKTDQYIIPAKIVATVRFPSVRVKVSPGTYYWQIFSEMGTPLSDPYPMIVTSGPHKYNGTYYYITSEDNKTAMAVPPTYGEYEGIHAIPSEIKGYQINEIRADACTFADKLNYMSIPETISIIEPGTFYNVTSMENIMFRAQTPPYLCEKAFNPELQQNIILNCPHGTANVYARETEYENFKLSSWDISVDSDDITLTTQLDIDPMTGKTYEPYYVSGDEELKLQFEAPEDRSVRLQIDIEGEKIEYDAWRNTALPTLRGKHGTVSIISIDSSSVDHIESDSKPDNLYSVDGMLIRRDFDRKDLDKLPAGIYILNGEKLVVK